MNSLSKLTLGFALALSSFLASSLRAQTTDLYDEGTLRTLSLTFAQSDWWAQLTANYGKNIDIKADLTVDGKTYKDVGVSFKGNASYRGTGTSKKKSFNVTIDAFVPGQSVQGYETLNLHNSYKDPTFVREQTTYHVLRKYMPAPKANFVKLVINKENWGIYGNVQQVNKECIAEWFAEDDGARFKPETTGSGGGASLVYLGRDPNLYKTSFSLKSNSPVTAWTDLVTAADVLNNTSLAQLPTELPKVINVDRALWYVGAVNIFASLDSYLGSNKNFYLYFDPLHGDMSILPWDFNESFGKNGRNLTIAERQRLPLFYQATNKKKPLISRLLAVPAWKERYVHHVRALLNDFDWRTLGPLVTKYQNLIRTEVRADTKKLYSYALFANNVTADVRLKGNGPADTPGLKPFTDIRRAFLLALPELKRTFPTIAGIRHTPTAPKDSDTVYVTASIRALGGVAAASLHYRTKGAFSRTAMFDDGLHGDGKRGDGTFGAAVGRHPIGTTVEYYVSAVATNGGAMSFSPTNAEHAAQRYTVEPKTGSSPIRIHEFMAKNDTGIVDEKKQHEDWIELWNSGTSAIDLAGFHLTDDVAVPKKWTFPPNTVVTPRGTLLVWADDDPNDGPLHASFKLSAAGESIHLFARDGVTRLDSVTFGAQQADVSCGRLPGALHDFLVKFTASTPRRPNEASPCGHLPYIATMPTKAPLGLSGNTRPVPGQTVTYALTRAPASAPGVFLIAGAPASIDIDRFGSLLLRPDLLILSAPIQSDATGAARIALPIPKLSGLAGSTFYFQALVLTTTNTGVFSNAVSTLMCR